MKFIAEFCQNHNGSFSLLQEMIHSAAEAGATYGKIQTIFADNLTYRPRFERGNHSEMALVRPYKEEFERLKQLDLSWEQQHQFIEECLKFGLKPMTTVFTRSDVTRVLGMGWDAIKLASYDCGSLPLIRALADGDKKLYISTGASYDHEVTNTANYLSEVNQDFTFLHCVTIYPTPMGSINLSRMNWLRQYSPEVGLSDHSLVAKDGILASQAALYLGADLIERHFTSLPPEDTKDGPVSIGRSELEALVEFSLMTPDEQRRILKQSDAEWERVIGVENPEMTDEELRNRDYYRGRFATKDKAGNYQYNWEEID